MIKARRDELESRHLPAEERRDLVGRLPRRALAVTGPEPSAGRVPDAVARSFLKACCRELRDLLEEESAPHRSPETFLEMLLFALAFGVAKSRDQRTAVEHHRRIGGKHHVRQVRNTGHDLKPGSGSGERCCQRLEAALGRGEVTRRIFRPGARLHPWVDPVGHLEVRGIGQQQQRLRRHSGFSAKKSSVTEWDTL